MDCIRKSQFKFLNQIAKRRLIKRLYQWRYTSFRNVSSKVSTPEPKTLKNSSINGQLEDKLLIPRKITHRFTNSFSAISSPDLKNSYSAKVHKSPIKSSSTLNLFDEIKKTLQTKASNIEVLNQLESKKNLKAEKKNPFERAKFKHKRTNTLPDVQVAVVSTKTKISPYKINIINKE